MSKKTSKLLKKKVKKKQKIVNRKNLLVNTQKEKTKSVEL